MVAALENNGTLWICDDRGEEFAKGIFITPIGLIRSAKDLDKDGIINLDDSENVLLLKPAIKLTQLNKTALRY